MHCPLPPVLLSCAVHRPLSCAAVVLRSLKTQASLIWTPQQLGAACVYWAYITMGLEPQTPDGSSFCEFARTPASTLEGAGVLPVGVCCCLCLFACQRDLLGQRPAVAVC